MPSNGIQVGITGEITPTALSDTFPVINPYWGLGGLRNVADATDRDAITASRREAGMIVYVASTGHYFQLGAGLTNVDWTDLGTTLGGGGGGGTPEVSITNAALAALISGNSVAVGTIYRITDSQDALGGTITVLGVATNRVDGNGQWSFVGKLPAQGRFKLATGTSGSVDQISVVMPSGTLNLMTASVPYTTSRNNTATLVVANINANTAVSGCRAYVITSTTSAGNFDAPLICIEAVETTTSFVHTMVVTLTTLTISGQVNPTIGFTPNNLVLQSLYDLTNDRILSARDLSRNCSVTTSTTRITALGYNPVTTFRWADIRFVSFNLVDSGYKDTSFRNVGTSVWRNITWTNTSCTSVVFSTPASANVNLLSGSILLNINNVSLAITQHNGVLNLQNLDITGSLSINNNTGNITIGSSTNVGSYSINTNTGNITINTNTSTSTISINSNVINTGVVLNISSNTIPTVFTLLRNRINRAFDITGSTLVATTIQDNDINGVFLLANNTYTTSINIRQNNIIANTETLSTSGLSISGSALPTIFFVSNTLCLDFESKVISPTVLNVASSTMSSTFIPGTIVGGPFNIEQSTIGAFVNCGTAPLVGPFSSLSIFRSNVDQLNLIELEQVNISKSDVSNVSMSATAGCASILFNCVESYLSDLVINDDTYFGFVGTDAIEFDSNKCDINNSTILLGMSTATPAYVSSIINNSTVSLGVINGLLVTSTLTNSIINSSTLTLRSTQAGTATIVGLNMDHSTLRDDPNLILMFNTAAITNLELKNAVSTILAGAIVITDCKFSDVTNLLIDASNALLNTVIQNGRYVAKKIIDFAAVAYSINTDIGIVPLLNDFVFEKITYSTLGLTAGAGATLSMGSNVGANNYFSGTLVTAINSAVTSRVSGLVNRFITVPGVASMRIGVATITDGKLTMVIEGQLLQD